jgi:hypothetical protein
MGAARRSVVPSVDRSCPGSGCAEPFVLCHRGGKPVVALMASSIGPTVLGTCGARLSSCQSASRDNKTAVVLLVIVAELPGLQASAQESQPNRCEQHSRLECYSRHLIFCGPAPAWLWVRGSRPRTLPGPGGQPVADVHRPGEPQMLAPDPGSSVGRLLTEAVGRRGVRSPQSSYVSAAHDRRRQCSV